MTAQLKSAPDQQAPGPFVVNLCASTTPMALTQPGAPELKQFSFFMSRRREDGRERFRLHMGYFLTFAEAEEWLNVVRDIYPGAWGGEAPGKKLAERAAAALAPKILPAPAAVPAVNQTKSPIAPAAAAPSAVPTVHAAEKAVAGVTAPPNRAPAVKAVPVSSNVREVLKSLDDTGTGETRRMPAAAPVAGAVPTRNEASLSDSQVLKILESRRPDDQAPVRGEVHDGIAFLRPDDSGTVRALKEAVRNNAPVSFAVQLQWSVQPIDIAKMPPLAIFSAYTLYTVEGSRDGRKWYGLRLGFFGDAISAKQVAGYVRSEFTSVAVVPVSPQERTSATEGEKKAAVTEVPRPRKTPGQFVEEFKLLDAGTDDAGAENPAVRAQVTAKKAAAALEKIKARAATGKPSRKAGSKVRATEKRPAKTLEETLEILGANELEIDNGRNELLNDSGVRHLRVQVQRNSPFARLLERLSERARKT